MICHLMKHGYVTKIFAVLALGPSTTEENQTPKDNRKGYDQDLQK